MRTQTVLRLITPTLALVMTACAAATPSAPTAAPVATAAGQTARQPGVLILATTTSTDDSGLLDAILPGFEAAEGVDVQVIAVGTGQALALGAAGDADVVLVHARAQEDAFVAEGNGVNRRDVMYNDFVLVGPADDPAGVKDMAKAQDALAQIASAGAPFASRGDKSGTHSKELGLWKAAALTPVSGENGYVELGQGMGETLIYANESGAYTLTDRATWLASQSNLPDLAVMVGGASIDANPDTGLYNPYGVIAVNPEKFPHVNAELAERFIAWITSAEVQAEIGGFGIDQYGQALFFASATTP